MKQKRRTMATINEIKEQMVVVGSVGDFTNALQQIATMRMMKLRDKVLQSRPFVEEAQKILAELIYLQDTQLEDDLKKLKKEEMLIPTHGNGRAVIIITSNQGLTGLYNVEIFQKIEKIIADETESDFYIIGKKGQEAFQSGRYKVINFPYEVKEEFEADDLRRLTALFDHYRHISLIYSKYVNTATREVVYTSITTPTPEQKAPETTAKEPEAIRYTFEPDINQLINGISHTLRDALFQQQIMDARLSQNSAQMIGMQTASENANNLLADLQIDYNKQRRKLIDKKIGEVFAGSALW